MLYVTEAFCLLDVSSVLVLLLHYTYHYSIIATSGHSVFCSAKVTISLKSLSRLKEPHMLTRRLDWATFVSHLAATLTDVRAFKKYEAYEYSCRG